MKSSPWKKMDRANTGGFTLIELLIAMLVSGIVCIAVVFNYASQQRAATSVRQVAQMQQQLRGAFRIMEMDIRAAGYDPGSARLFGITNVQRWDITDENTAYAVDANGSPAMRIAYDWDPANAAVTGDGLLNEPSPAYRLFDDNNDGILDLVRDDDFLWAAGVGMNRQLVAEGIDAIGLAYAYDNNNDGDLDRLPPGVGGNIIWAVDSNNDNRLDTNLDANGDGIIDLTDDTDADFRITPADGGVLPAPVPLNRIRMVRIWLLARATNADNRFINNGQSFLVGDQVVPAVAGGFTDNVRRRLMVRTIECRNMVQ
ncbi:MAG: prepilin-type N-terminal cleavage/methylation domain-containing protein [Desulfatitalea sp.]|nr:prepilin-type N-terminal cleavage/methylation domain-containing protein [Desulfatitalea sp.]NNK02522.1 prepilin-type N-terminal cleavage/methylation domain-containing protein [Desulfatitalea sp.]